MSKEILVLCPFGLDAGLLSKAVDLAQGNVRLLIPGEDRDKAIAYGAQNVHLLESGKIVDESAFADYLAEKIGKWRSEIVLASATVQMRNVMPLLAWRLGAGLTADCTALEMTDGSLLQTRPAFGNSLMATICSVSNVQMATVRPGTFSPVQKPSVDAKVVSETYLPAQDRVRQLSFEPFTQGMPLHQAQIIVAGGMGVGSKKGFEKLKLLATKLGAGLGASRTAVDAGFAPFSCQIGMTGVTVSPKLYIAVGISGAVQHLAGMSGAEKVIAINSDPKAPIFDYADYGIVGDWENVIDKLLEESL